MNRYHATVTVDQRLSGIEGLRDLEAKTKSRGEESLDIILIYGNEW